MTERKIPIEEIAKLADDVRLIKDFSENHNFNRDLLSARTSPIPDSSGRFGWSFATMSLSTILVLAIIAVIKFWNPPLSAAVSGFMFVVGLVFVIIASMAAHMRFQNNVVTIILVVGLLVVLLIGAGIFTAKEAVEKAGEFSN